MSSFNSREPGSMVSSQLSSCLLVTALLAGTLPALAQEAVPPAPPPVDWLSLIALAVETREPDSPGRSGLLTPLEQTGSWICPYALMLGGGAWRVDHPVRGEMDPSDWMVLQVDRLQGILALRPEGGESPLTAGIPAVDPGALGTDDKEVWVSAGVPGAKGGLVWVQGERLPTPHPGLIPGPRLRIRLTTELPVLPGAVVVNRAGGLASVERGLPGQGSLFECVLWPDSSSLGSDGKGPLADLERTSMPVHHTEWWAFGELNLAAGHPDIAYSALQQAWELSPGSWQVACLLALAAAQCPDAEFAPWMEKAIGLAPERQEVQTAAMSLADLARDPVIRDEWLDTFDQAGVNGPDLVLGRARQAIDREDWQTALDRLQDPLLQETLPGQALRWTGRCCLEVGRPVEAIKWLTEATQHLPGDAEVWDWLCLAGLEARDFRLAAEAGKNAISLDPEFATAYHHLGLALANWDQPVLAAEAFRQAILLNPGNIASMTNLGKLLVWLGHAREAEPLLDLALQLDPTNQLALVHLAELEVQRGRLDKAEERARQAVNAIPADPDGWSCLSQVIYRAGRTEEAIDALEKAIERAPDRAELWTRRVQWESDSRSADRVLKQARRALVALPDHPPLVELYGLALLDLGQTDEAARVFEQGANHAPRNAGLWLGLAQCRRRRGDVQEAIEMLREALPKVDRPGRVAGQLGLLIGLQSCLQDAPRFREEYPGQLWDEYSETRAKMLSVGQADQLLPYFLDLKKEVKPNPYLDLFAAQAYLDRGQPERAEPVLRNLAAPRLIGPVEGDEYRINLLALERLADLYRRQGALEEAARTARELIWLNPYSEAGYVVLGTALVNRGESTRALRELEKGFELFPRSWTLQVIRTTALARTKQWEAALRALGPVLMVRPGAMELHYLAAFCQFNRSRFSEARQFLQRVLDSDPHHRQALVLMELVERQMELGGTEGAT